MVVVAGAVVVGGEVVVGSVEMVVVGGEDGGGLKMTSGLVTVVAGAGAVVVATVGVVPGAGAVVAVVVEGAGAVEEVLLEEVVDAPGAFRPSITTVDGNPEIGGCMGGRITVAAGVVGEASRDTAATRMTATTAPTPRLRRMLVREDGSRASHQMRIRSRAGGRPNAAFLPMDDHAR